MRRLSSLHRLCLMLALVAGLLAAGGFALTSVAVAQKGGGGGKKTIPSGPGWIAFNDGGIIGVMNPDGSSRTPVALAQTIWEKPAWSPVFTDGSLHLAFKEYDAETDRDLLMTVQVFPDIGQPVPVSGLEMAGGLFQVDWSPSEPLGDGFDGVRVCFSTFDPEFVLEDQVVRIEDLVYDSATGVFQVDPLSPGPVIVDAGPGASYWQGRFSPDGNWLVLGRNEVPSGAKSIWLSTTDGAVQKPLIDEAGVYNWYPAWSPDGAQLAFISDRAGRPCSEIYVADLVADLNGDLEVTAITQMTHSAKVCEYWPTWSPDGWQIGYRSEKGVGKVLPGGQQFELGPGRWPDWSPVDLPPLR